MPFCTETEWNGERKCCMDGYAIEHVRDMAYDNGARDTVEARFLDQYPCVNGAELDQFVEKFTGEKVAAQVERSATNDTIWGSVSRSLNAILRRFGCRE